MARKSAAEKFIENLDTDAIRNCLRKIAALPEKERRAVIASPAPYFKKAGIGAPPGVTVKISKKPFKREDVPREVLPDLPPLERPVIYCYWVTVYVIINNEIFINSKLVCVAIESPRAPHF